MPVTHNGKGRPSAADIDRSCRGPLLLMLFQSGAIWLVVGLVLALIASVKLHAPGFLANVPGLTLGRVRPAAMNALVYGFATQTGLGVLVWIMCRLSRARLPGRRTIVIAGAFWNLAVTIGVLAILGGGSTGFEWLEMPGYVAPILFVSFCIIGLCALAAFNLREPKELYVTQWYFVAALFWFPWIYSAANLQLLYRPVRGVLQAAVNAWYTNNLLNLWFAPLGLGIIFYFLPKLLQRPLYSSRLAAFGFWTLALFANWAGLTQLIGGPLPTWLISVSVAANLLLIVPILAVAINWHWTVEGNYRKAAGDLPLRFILFSAGSYLVAAVTGLLLGVPDISEVTHFTYAEPAQRWLALLGFVGMGLFGSLYYLAPRLAQNDWPSARLARLHFWCSAGGISLLFLALTIGGVIQGIQMNLGTVDFVSLGKVTMPFVGLATLGLLALLVGQIAFAANFGLLLHRFAAPFRRSAAGFLGRTNGHQKEAGL